MQLIKYYRNAVFIPSGVVIWLCITLAIYDGLIGGIHSGKLMSKSFLIEAHILAQIIQCILICILSTPIFLNRITTVRNNLLLSAVSWFILPMSWMTWISLNFIGYINYMITNSHIYYGDIIAFFSSIFPFVFGLIFTFMKFRIDLKLIKQELSLD